METIRSSKLHALAAVLVAVFTLTVVAGGTTSTYRDPRCVLTTLTNAQCAAGFADNGINGDQ